MSDFISKLKQIRGWGIVCGLVLVVFLLIGVLATISQIDIDETNEHRKNDKQIEETLSKGEDFSDSIVSEETSETNVSLAKTESSEKTDLDEAGLNKLTETDNNIWEEAVNVDEFGDVVETGKDEIIMQAMISGTYKVQGTTSEISMIGMAYLVEDKNNLGWIYVVDGVLGKHDGILKFKINSGKVEEYDVVIERKSNYFVLIDRNGANDMLGHLLNGDDVRCIYQDSACEIRFDISAGNFPSLHDRLSKKYNVRKDNIKNNNDISVDLREALSTIDNDSQRDDTSEDDESEKHKDDYEIKPESEINKSDFVFWDSDRRYLKDEEIVNLDLITIQTAINEIYARHGRIWTTEWNDYFHTKSWYEPKYTEEEFSTSVFNKYEKDNVDLLSVYRAQKNLDVPTKDTDDNSQGVQNSDLAKIVDKNANNLLLTDYGFVYTQDLTSTEGVLFSDDRFDIKNVRVINVTEDYIPGNYKMTIEGIITNHSGKDVQNVVMCYTVLKNNTVIADMESGMVKIDLPYQEWFLNGDEKMFSGELYLSKYSAENANQLGLTSVTAFGY